jgi:hypothetical protein
MTDSTTSAQFVSELLEQFPDDVPAGENARIRGRDNWPFGEPGGHQLGGLTAEEIAWVCESAGIGWSEEALAEGRAYLEATGVQDSSGASEQVHETQHSISWA